MRFSIITITKDNPVGFSKTKASVESQTFKDYEWVVIDGNTEHDNGIYDAMNKGIERSSGGYLIFMNAGDTFADSHTLSLISEYNSDFIYGDAIEGHIIKRARPHTKIHQGMITHHQAMIYRRTSVDNLRYDEAYKLAADYKFTFQFLRRTQNVHYIPYPVCVFEQGGVSQQYAPKVRQEEAAIRKELGVYAPLTYWRQICSYYFKQYAPQLYLKIRNIIER